MAEKPDVCDSCGAIWKIIEEQDAFLTPSEALKTYGQSGVLGTRRTIKRCGQCGAVSESLTALDHRGVPVEDF